MDKNTRRKAGKLFLSLVAIILVALLSIVSTIAYLSDKDGVEIHRFTLGEGVDVDLIQDTAEPEEFYPEKEYPEKRAMVKIPDTAMEYEYIAVKVQFFTEKEIERISGFSLFSASRSTTTNALQFVGTSYSDFSKDYGKLKSYPEVATNTAIASGSMISGTRPGWKVYGETRNSENGTLYLYYGEKYDNGTDKVITGDTLTKVEHGSELMLFDSIKINKDCDEKYPCAVPEGIELYDQNGVLYTTRIIQDDQLKGFRIVVTAYAVQGDIKPEEAQNALVQMMNGEIVPEISSTPTGSSIVASAIPTGGSIVVSATPKSDSTTVTVEPTEDSVTATAKPTEDTSLVTPTSTKDDNTAITNPPEDGSTESPSSTYSVEIPKNTILLQDDIILDT